MNVFAIFDAAMAASEALHKEDERQREAFARRPRCGNCYFWLKSRDCPREKNVNGQSRGPSCNGSPCEKYRSKGEA